MWGILACRVTRWWCLAGEVSGLWKTICWWKIEILAFCLPRILFSTSAVCAAVYTLWLGLLRRRRGFIPAFSVFSCCYHAAYIWGVDCFWQESKIHIFPQNISSPLLGFCHFAMCVCVFVCVCMCMCACACACVIPFDRGRAGGGWEGIAKLAAIYALNHLFFIFLLLWFLSQLAREGFSGEYEPPSRWVGY